MTLSCIQRSLITRSGCSVPVLLLLLSSLIASARALGFNTTAVTIRGNLSFVADLIVVDHNLFSLEKEEPPTILVAGPQLLQASAVFHDDDDDDAPSASLLFNIPDRGNEAVVAADMNQDGWTDLIVAASNDFVQSIDGAIKLYQNDGNGNFQKQILVSPFSLTNNLTGSTTGTMSSVNGRAIQVADVTGDGYPDILAVVSPNSFVSPQMGYLLLLVNDSGTGQFTTRVIAEDLNGPALLDVGDLNGDGILDIALVVISTRPGSRPLRVWYGAGDGTFGTSSEIIDDGARGNMAISIGKLNGDGHADILTMGLSDICVYYGSAIGAFTKEILATFDPLTHSSVNYRDWKIEVFDADGDGLKDIIAIFGLRPDVQWMKQTSDGSFERLTSLVPVSTAGEFVLHDLNQDNVVDILVHSELEQRLFAFYGDTEGTDVAPTTSPAATPATNVPTGTPTSGPTSVPTGISTVTPTSGSTGVNTQSPSLSPTRRGIVDANSQTPSDVPSPSPSDPPSSSPSEAALISDPPSDTPSISPSRDPSNSSSSAPTSTTFSPTNAPTETCQPLGAACTSDFDCCGFGPNLICVGVCKRRERSGAPKDNESKLYKEPQARGSLNLRKRKLRGSTLAE